MPWAAAALLAPALLRGAVPEKALAAVQRRRRTPTVVVQSAQRLMHRALLIPVQTGTRRGAPPVLLFLAQHVPALRRVVPRLIAFGPRAEHAPAFARRAQPRV